jgi:hypothetical protein
MSEHGLPLSRDQFNRLFAELRLERTEVVKPGARWWLQGGIVVTLVTAEERFYASIEVRDEAA